MKILYASDFDPAGVHLGHRDALRDARVDAYVAARLAYRHRSDFDRESPSSPDVIVVCPGIGDGSGDWAAKTEDRGKIGYQPDWVWAILNRCPNANRVALFHGSPHTWAHRAEYARHWSAAGFALAATTLDYATEMDAAWLPPAVSVKGFPLADLRAVGSPLFVVQTPSVTELCHTQEFISAAQNAGYVVATGARGVRHDACLYFKARFHAGFDHMRGSFSTNTIENAALRLVPIFGLNPLYADRMLSEYVWKPSFTVWPPTIEELTKVFQALFDAKRTRMAQEEGRDWYFENFFPEKIANRLLRFFERVIE
jgi:hypothetical protein